MQLDLPFATLPTVYVRHRWARRYILRVLDDGTLRVTLPRRGSKRDAIAFVERSGSWIDRQRQRLESQLASARDVPERAADHERWRDQASRELPPALLDLAHTHGVSVARVSVRNQKSRWGACSA